MDRWSEPWAVKSYVNVVAESMHKFSLSLVAKACSQTRPRSMELIMGLDLVHELTLLTSSHVLGAQPGSWSIDTSTIYDVLRGLIIQQFQVSVNSIMT